MRKAHRKGIRAALLCCALASQTGSGLGAENGSGFYLLGSKGPAAAILPPAGLYLQNDLYLYDGRAGGGRELPVGGRIGADLRVRTFIEMPTLLWTTPWEVFGGRLALTATAVVGGPDLKANIVVGPFLGRGSDSIFTFGDPVFGAVLGWNSGNFHWSLNTALNVPIGDYRKGALANISFNRWAGDVSAAATWFDPTVGIDISGVAGVTFNGENPATNYRTGTEFHFEGAVSKYLTPNLSVGAVGYYYQQISGDGGRGATLGPFRGRVAALGATASYSFTLGKLPITARVKVFREFDVKNRLEGTSGTLTISMPLYVAGQ